MKMLAPAIFGLALVNAGCSLIANGTQNLVTEVRIQMEERRERSKFKHLARQALREQKCLGNSEINKDYNRGFEAGFVDYLMEGGTGEPPAIPPRHYWASRYESPKGFQQIQAWYAGYRQGSAVAIQSGYRQFVTLPSGLNEVKLPATVFPAAIPGRRCQLAAPVETPPEQEVLPQPRTTK